MPIAVTLGIAVVCAAGSAVNGFVGVAFLILIWMWLNAGVLPSVRVYLKTEPAFTWAPHLLLPLILFLILWQLRLRGRIGPRTTLRQMLRGRRSIAVLEASVPAGIRQRIGAAIVDFAAVAALYALFWIAKPSLGALSFLGDAADVIAWIIAILIPLMYFAGAESSDGQGTLGKKYVGIVVGDENGNKISFAMATMRLLAKLVTLGLGFLLAFADKRHQALHDKLAKTLVVYEI